MAVMFLTFLDTFIADGLPTGLTVELHFSSTMLRAAYSDVSMWSGACRGTLYLFRTGHGLLVFLHNL